MEMLLLFVLLLPACLSLKNVTEDYDPIELLTRIFKTNDILGRAGYGLVNFGNQNLPNDGLGGPPIKFEDVDYGGNVLQQNIKKKRRRKPKKQAFVQNYFDPNFEENLYNGPLPPTSQALSSVTQALTSVATHDDLQCVPRLLCESASGALGSSQVFQTVSGLEQILTLVSAYGGISTNPLFVFGRAVLLGVSSKGNPSACRYAYPHCPTDPERLVHYLNNHNGGFFRFFNSPEQQQSLNQFYNNLSPNYQQPNQYPNPGQQNYGLYKPGLYESSLEEQYSLTYNNYNINKPKTRIEKRIQNTPSANSIKGNSKWKFPNRNEEPDFEYGIEANEDEYFVNNDFKFPEDKDRKTRGFTFPENINTKYTANQESDNFVFSNQNYAKHDENYKYNDKYNQNNNKYVENYNYNDKYNQNNIKYVENYKYNDKYNHHYTNNYHYTKNNDFENGQTVYVVRGNGDPNKPEVIKLKPGQSIREAI